MDFRHHTTLPWNFAHETGIISSHKAAQSEQGTYVAARAYGDDQAQIIANAEFICRSCNNHAALIGALENAINAFEKNWTIDTGAWKEILERAR